MANPNVYDQHDKAFANVSAYVVLKDGERVATVAFKHGAAVTVYVHWIGLEMTKGRAGGGGYDRKTAACARAVESMPHPSTVSPESTNVQDYRHFVTAMLKDGGDDWTRALEKVGFTVLQAV